MRTPHIPNSERGFSIMELLVAMGISMVLLAALASIFANSVQSRERIDKEGQKIENARYSLDTLAEDVRLAGYYGILAPGLAGATLVNGATAADYTYVNPCETTPNANAAPLSNLSGWDSTGASNITVPMAIFGYDGHAGSLPTALTNCLLHYKTGTDVLVLRRTSASSILPGATVANNPYLQVQSCPFNQPTQPPRFITRSTGTNTEFNLLMLDCTSATAGTTSSVRKLVYRIYYISQCDDCVNNLDNNSLTPGDGIPSLKMIELDVTSDAAEVVYLDTGNNWASGRAGQLVLRVRTIAPNVDDIHVEYGIDTSDDGAIDTWVVSNNNPRQTGATGTAVAGMRLDTNTQNRWEDVMAIKLFLITRDTKPTTGYIDTKSFIAGTRTIAAANDPYRRRLMSTTIKLVNMAGRRETP